MPKKTFIERAKNAIRRGIDSIQETIPEYQARTADLERRCAELEAENRKLKIREGKIDSVKRALKTAAEIYRRIVVASIRGKFNEVPEAQLKVYGINPALSRALVETRRTLTCLEEKATELKEQNSELTRDLKTSNEERASATNEVITLKQELPHYIATGVSLVESLNRQFGIYNYSTNTLIPASPKFTEELRRAYPDKSRSDTDLIERTNAILEPQARPSSSTKVELPNSNYNLVLYPIKIEESESEALVAIAVLEKRKSKKSKVASFLQAVGLYSPKTS